jgi:hypothetical protein
MKNFAFIRNESSNESKFIIKSDLNKSQPDDVYFCLAKIMINQIKLNVLKNDLKLSQFLNIVEEKKDDLLYLIIKSLKLSSNDEFRSILDDYIRNQFFKFH